MASSFGEAFFFLPLSTIRFMVSCYICGEILDPVRSPHVSKDNLGDKTPMVLPCTLETGRPLLTCELLTRNPKNILYYGDNLNILLRYIKDE